MGFEYKLRTTLTEKQTTEIQLLLKSDKLFDKEYEFDNKVFWDFRHKANNGKIPNISIVFETEGIYICQWGTSFLWTDLDKLKNYIENEQIKYEIIDYQE